MCRFLTYRRRGYFICVAFYHIAEEGILYVSLFDMSQKGMFYMCRFSMRLPANLPRQVLTSPNTHL